MSDPLQLLLPKVIQYAKSYSPHPDASPPLDDLVAILRLIPSLDKTNLAVTAQISALLTALSISGLESDPRVLAVCSNEIASHWAHPLLLPTQHLDDPICDIVGTGGDGFNTFNVSTAAAIVAAGAGLKVCKHGNRASSSATGSADLIIANGIPLPSLSPSHLSALIPSTRFSFLFSPTFYPIFASLAPIRRAIGFRTLFNLLGPLLNPAKPSRLLLGVSDPKLGPTVASALGLLGCLGSWVVCGDEGLDEISPEGSTSVWKVESRDQIQTFKIEPLRDFGLPCHPLKDVIGGNPHENIDILNKLLQDSSDKSKHEMAIYDFVLMNSAALLVVGGKALNLKDGVQLAKQSLSSGQAKQALEIFKIEVNEQLEKSK